MMMPLSSTHSNALAYRQPILANDIAEALDLLHYPVLITKDGLEQ